jgi:hypothetical protein
MMMRRLSAGLVGFYLPGAEGPDMSFIDEVGAASHVFGDGTSIALAFVTISVEQLSRPLQCPIERQ